MPRQGTLYGATPHHKPRGQDMEQTNLNELLAAINAAHATGNSDLVAELEASLEVFETI
jgi:hypothetical protein